MTLLGTLALALSGVLPLMKRVNYYYAAPQFLLLPEVLQAEEDAKRRRILTVLIVLAFAAETIVAVGIYNERCAAVSGARRIKRIKETRNYVPNSDPNQTFISCSKACV